MLLYQPILAGLTPELLLGFCLKTRPMQAMPELKNGASGKT
jgi:hypothetical protein